jgi:hypothetical protein
MFSRICEALATLAENWFATLGAKCNLKRKFSQNTAMGVVWMYFKGG